jgi:hypothetical protein
MTDLTDAEISHILTQYKNRKESYKSWYNKIKDTEEFKKKNRERARQHYYKNGYKEKKAENYTEKIELNRAKNSFRYYKNNDRIDEYRTKYPDRYELLVSVNYCSLRDNNPSESTETSSES